MDHSQSGSEMEQFCEQAPPLAMERNKNLRDKTTHTDFNVQNSRTVQDDNYK